MATTTSPTAKPKANGKANIAAAKEEQRQITIPVPELTPVTLHIEGLSPLIVNRFSEKAMKQMADKMEGKAQQKKAARVRDEEFKSAAYVLPGHEDDTDWVQGKYYFPGSAFKHAYMFGISQLDDTRNFPKTRATAWFFVTEDPMLQFTDVTLRDQDVGRNPTRVLYRPQFNNWAVDLKATYDKRALTAEQLIAILITGGLGGIGEWRPSAPKNKSGSFGMFTVSGFDN